MELIKLPRHLPGDLDLAQINQQLRDGKAKLDWSLVEEASEQALTTLIQGLDIDAITELGGDSLSEPLSLRLLKILDFPPQPPSQPQAKLFAEKIFPAPLTDKPGQTALLTTEFVPDVTADGTTEKAEDKTEVNINPTSTEKSSLLAAQKLSPGNCAIA